MNVPREEGGFALLAALWLLVVLSSVALEFSLQARERRLATANALEERRARAAADAGIEHARARLERLLARVEPLAAAADPQQLLDPWGRPDTLLAAPVALEDAQYRLTLYDAGARLNLNLASEEELRRFFAALRVDAARADEIAQSILDWRDADDSHRLRGAEAEYYLREQAPALPRNAPFVEVAELRYVRGVTEEIYTRAYPHLTLLGIGQVNLATAERPVLLALPGMSEEAVAVLLRSRVRGLRRSSLFELPQQLSGSARRMLEDAIPELFRRTTLETRELVVHSEGTIEGSPIRAQVEVLFIPAGGTAHLVSRWVNR